MFAYATGPLAWSIVAFRNSMVFHSLDKVGSLLAFERHLSAHPHLSRSIPWKRTSFGPSSTQIHCTVRSSQTVRFLGFALMGPMGTASPLGNGEDSRAEHG